MNVTVNYIQEVLKYHKVSEELFSASLVLEYVACLTAKDSSTGHRELEKF